MTPVVCYRSCTPCAEGRHIECLTWATGREIAAREFAASLANRPSLALAAVQS